VAKMRESVFKSIFFRHDSTIGLWRWFKMLSTELYVGEQLLDLIGVTASHSKEKTPQDPAFTAPANGWRAELQQYIPATFLNRVLQDRITEVLEVKYGNSYNLIKQVGHQPGLWEQNPNRLYMISELRLAYNTCWTAFNILVDIIVYLITSDLAAALLAGGFIEALRRLKI